MDRDAADTTEGRHAASAEPAPAQRRRLNAAPAAASSTIVALFVLLMVGPFLRYHLQAVTVLRQLGGESIPNWMRSRLTQPVAVRDVTIPTTSGTVRARLYLPVGHVQSPGIVVFHGVHHLGINEPRLIGFARALSSCGIPVLTPELPDIKDYRVSQSSVAVIGDSVQWFAQQERHPVGVMGLSFSGGLALVAAENPAWSHNMRFVVTVASQGDMRRVASYYRTGTAARPDGSVETLKPHEYGPLVLEYEHVDEFVPHKDAAAIRPVLRAHLYEDKSAETTALDALSPAQHVEATRLMDASLPSTRALLQASEVRHSSDMAALSPEPNVRRIGVPVYLLHGEADNIIPATETLWMSSKLPPGTMQAELVSPLISHLDMQQEPNGWDEWKLVHFMAQVLRAAE